jgi:REP element-mobilizing transposase RayT
MFLDPSKEIEHHRHKLPHWQQDEEWVFVTWRLADSLPKAKLDQWNEQRDIWLSLHPQPWDEAADMEFQERFGKEVDDLLDQGYGSCLLREKANAEILAAAIRHFDGAKYQLGEYVIMPNHVHVLFSPDPKHKLADIMHSWKRHTTGEINKSLGQTGSLWQPDYWDRLIRSQRHCDWAQRYIEENPRNLREGEFFLWSAVL